MCLLNETSCAGAYSSGRRLAWRWAIFFAATAFSVLLPAVFSVLLPAAFSVLLPAATARSQPVGQLGGFEPSVSYPSNEYYAGLEIYRTGDLENAVEMFQSALRRTRKDINGRWVDAIPVYAMLAECYWQFGDLEEARRNADEALILAVRYRGWLGNVDWEGTLRQGAVTNAPSWLWPEARAIKRLPTSTRVQFQSGQIVDRSRPRRRRCH